MPLSQRVAQAFAPGGALAGGLTDFCARSGQQQMAHAVADAMQRGTQLVVEAGTGVGKTFAYLVPVLLSGQRVLLSTASKALQDQLYDRDIPQLCQLLGVAPRMALLKGRSSYLCRLRLAQARERAVPDASEATVQLATLERWSQATRSGDLAEVPTLDDASPLIPLVTSTRENCLGAACAHAATCFVNLARRHALASEVVVVNHHLFFADVSVRESGVAELLPTVDCVVFDEAHQLNEIGVQFLGQDLGAARVTGFARDLCRVAQPLAGGYASWDALAYAVVQAAQALGERFPLTDAPQRMDWSALGAGGIAQLERLVECVSAVHAALLPLGPMAPELQRMATRAADLVERVQQFAQPVAADSVRWLELGRQWRLIQAPLDIAQLMQTRVAPNDGTSGKQKAWIFTSATLGHDARLSWFIDHCGLVGADVLQVPSPFDYARQAALYIPPDFVAAADPGHSTAVAALALKGAQLLGGRTLVLTTTLRAMLRIGEALRAGGAAQSGLQVLVQGERPKRELLQRFVQRGCAVMVASASFWEGIDIPGSALQLVVIDKLPFAPPEDPLQQARARRLETNGKNPFTHLQLPQAAVALKQGAGRLIRRETDQGVLVVCDPRLQHRGYGRKLQAVLPPMQAIHTVAEFEQRLRQITRTSTTDVRYPEIP